VTSEASSIAPARLGKYEILSKIGDGGMASVYRARLYADLAGPARAVKEVALKLIHPHLSGEHDFTLMFLDEVRIAMAMSHRNIVQTFDAGQDGAQHYMVMELVNGCSVRRLLEVSKKAAPPIEIALFIATEICGALEYAHGFRPSEASEAGVVHRDVSPSNILLSTQGEVKLADFGVAKAAGRLHVSSADLIKGKLSYMAPEQARGNVEPRSDIFSLGAVLYRLVCGRPFRRRPDLDSARLVGEIKPPSVYRDDVTPALDALIVSCLAGDPKSRPESAAELRQLLGQEAFSMQLRLGGSRDMHAELRDYLERRDLLSTPEVENKAADSDKQADRIAKAMLEGALEVPTDHGSERSSTSLTDDADTTIDVRGREASSRDVAPVAPVAPDGGATAIISSDTGVDMLGPAVIVDPPQRSRRALFVVATVLLLAGLGIAAWALLDSEPPSATRALSVDAAVIAADQTSVAPARQPDSAAVVDAAADVAAEHGQTPDAAVDRQQSAADSAPAVSPPRKTRVIRRRRPPPRGFGSLDVNAIPWAKVYVDGKYRGVTPVQGVRLRAGRHRVRLVNPKWKVARRFVVTIVAKQRLRKVYQLTR